jgi:hypothetical protein
MPFVLIVPPLVCDNDDDDDFDDDYKKNSDHQYISLDNGMLKNSSFSWRALV